VKRTPAPSDAFSDAFSRAEEMIMDYLITQLPAKDGEGFVLAFSHMASQNIMVDEDGKVTGIIEWDMITMPRCVGCSGYPSWITHDWFPSVYEWPRSEGESSPDELKRYREYYNRCVSSQPQRMEGWELTERSHMWEAI